MEAIDVYLNRVNRVILGAVHTLAAGAVLIVGTRVVYRVLVTYWFR